MDIQKAKNLGVLHKQLGIDPNARVSVDMIGTVTVIRDYDKATEYVCHQGGKVETIPILVPTEYQEIFRSPTDELKKRWDDTWIDGADDVRMTIFAELRMRGVDMHL